MDVNIKIGSIVTIKDGSYMVRKVGKNFTEKYCQDGTSIGHCADYFKVIAVNIRLPISKPYGAEDVLGHQNNCKIQNLRTGEVWACSLINISNTEKLF